MTKIHPEAADYFSAPDKTPMSALSQALFERDEARAALQSRTEQEPFCFAAKTIGGDGDYVFINKKYAHNYQNLTALYTSPPDQSARIAELEAFVSEVAQTTLFPTNETRPKEAAATFVKIKKKARALIGATQ